MKYAKIIWNERVKLYVTRRNTMYQSAAMRTPIEERENNAQESWLNVGKALPPKSTKQAQKSTERGSFKFPEAGFADDVTLYDEKHETKQCKEIT